MNISSKQNPVNKIFGNKTSAVVLDMWHIEAFEGGTSPRKQTLEKISVAYGKINPGVFVTVINMTQEQFAINIKTKTPDLVSFASGCVDKNIFVDLPRPQGMQDSYIKACTYSEDIVCYPYMLGRYALISKEDIKSKDLSGEEIKTKNKNIFPLCVSRAFEWQKVLKDNGYSYTSVNPKASQYDGYVDFLEGKAKVMLGSQRDVHRLKMREEKGKIDSLYYTYLDGYTDLVQFVGVCKDSKSINVAKAFCENLLTYDAQSKLTSCGMFSLLYDIYTDGYMNEWESQIKKTSIVHC